MLPVTGINSGNASFGVADRQGESAKEFNALLEAQLPSFLYNLLVSDNAIIATLVPSLIVIAFSTVVSQLTMMGFFSQLSARLRDAWLRRNGFVERSIEVTLSNDYTFRKMLHDGLNKELQTAIKLFIGNNADKCFDTLARISLLEITDNKSNWSRLNLHRSSEELKRMKIIVGPEPHTTFRIPNANPTINLEIIIKSEPSSTAYEKRQKTTYILTTKHSSHEAGKAHIDAFVKQCYEDYRKTMDATKVHGRFLYQLQSQPTGKIVMLDKAGDEGGGSDEKDDADIPAPSKFKRYRLSDDKDFDSLFFPGKKEILRLIDDFRDSNGKFAIEGFPRKLGLLLSGPSGTGKTAFVKALATYLGRHIITLPLEKIKTNQQLYDIMFEEQYVCTNTDKNQGKAELVSNDKVIFLMEVDGAFDIVRSRKAGPESSSSTPQLKADRMKDLLFNRADQLDLAGLLNALDGVVDSPGRVVIMSTSAVDELDAALVRPGRINRILNMGYITLDCAKQLLTHHFGEEAFATHEKAFEDEWRRKEEEALAGTASRTQSYMSPQALVNSRQRSPGVSPRDTPRTNALASPQMPFQMAPAELEQLCIDNDTLGEVLEAFKRYPEVENLLH